MNIQIASFTKAGAQLAQKLVAGLAAQGDQVAAHSFCDSKEISLHDWTKAAWQTDAILLIGATGIAVRAVAPFVRDKLKDPAVISLDERAGFAIALLGGHVGGANRLAIRVAKLTGAQPVISTATDLNGRFAVDVWAKDQQVHLLERVYAKEVSAALLAGRTVGLYSAFPVVGELPQGLVLSEEPEIGICISLDAKQMPFAKTLHAVPQCVTVGVGCRKGADAQAFEELVLETLETHQISVQAVGMLASIDLKENEPCIQAFCTKYGISVAFYSAQELMQVAGDFSKSQFVMDITGVDSVCERAAMFPGGKRLLVQKTAKEGITVAVAATDWRACFADTDGGNRL